MQDDRRVIPFDARVAAAQNEFGAIVNDPGAAIQDQAAVRGRNE